MDRSPDPADHPRPPRRDPANPPGADVHGWDARIGDAGNGSAWHGARHGEPGNDGTLLGLDFSYDREPWQARLDPRPPGGQRRGAAVGIALLGLMAGLVGGFAGGRLSRGTSPEPAVVRPVVREVVATGDTTSADQIQAVAGGLLPVTVQIRTDGGSRGGTGSGVIMRPDGFILTNNHVVDQADTIAVVLPSSEALEGRLIGKDPANDLAVVKVDRDGLPVANFGRSADLKVGELAVAVGSPFGLQGSVTAGIVSALHRVVEVGQDERLVNAIQTDASINPGNSGGALANGRGQVIGINTAIATGGPTDANAGVGFAIPIDEALEVAADLIAGRPVHTPRLGVEGGIDLTPEVAERYGVQGRTGALVMGVTEGGAAERAGMRAGDLVVRIGVDEIHGWDQLVVAVGKAEVGQAVPVVVVRQGRELTLQVTPTERP